MTHPILRHVRLAGLALLLLVSAVAGSATAQERGQGVDAQGGVTLIDAGSGSVCGLQPDGRAVCWGDNGSYQSTPPANDRFVQLEAGDYLACGLRADGVARCWGHSSYTGVPGGETFKAIAVGRAFACGLRPQGTTVCWGSAATPPATAFVDIEAGGDFACGLQVNGTVSCWGSNTYGQLSPATGVAFSSLALGSSHACGLGSNGLVSCWGNNSWGQATPPAPHLQNFVSLTAGPFNTCGLRADGSATCWGYNGWGESTVPAGQSFTSLTAGSSRTCGLRANGTPLCWGGDFGASLGQRFSKVDIGAYFGCGIRTDGSPFCWGIPNYGQSTVPAGETFASIATGSGHACGLRANGSLRCWGRNDFGQATTPAGTFLQVSAGDTHTCARRADGTLQCWGEATDGRTTPPAGAFVQVSAGVKHSCALRADGSVACWGTNPYGGATSPAETGFVRVAAADWFSCGLRNDGSIGCWGGWYWSVPPGDGYVDLVAGRGQVCGLHADGSVRCGGVDQFGQASAPSGTFTALAADDDASCGLRPGGALVCWGRLMLPDAAAGPFGMGSLAPGWQHSCQRGAGGGVTCWGDNAEGQGSAPAVAFAELEVGDRNSCGLRADGAVQCWGRTAEGQGSAPTGPFKTLRVGPYTGCGLRPNGAIACWGLNNYGQATPPALTSQKALDAGYFHGCSVSSANTVTCWGRNTEGQATPPPVYFLDVSVGEHHSCGLRFDFNVECWGRNTNGSTDIQIGPFRALAAGRFHNCAIRNDGTLTCWGANDTGQSTPPTTGRYVSVSAGMSHSCAIRDDGVRVCWGSNASGANPDLVLSPAAIPNVGYGTAYPATQFTVAGPNYTPTLLAYGITAGALPAGLTFSSDGLLSGTPVAWGSFTFTVEAEDGNGFIASREYMLQVVDVTSPVITPNVSGTLGDNGWYRSDVGIAWTVSDPESGIASTIGCTPSTLATDSPGASYHCHATNGDDASWTVSVVVKRDATLPTISSALSSAPNASGWHRVAVTLTYTCTDATSGVASCPAADTVSTEGTGVQSPARSATDVAGNTRAVTRRSLNIDTTAPEAAIDDGPLAQSDSASATFAFSATDALSGIEALECSLDGAAFAACGSPLTFNGLADGEHSFAVRARDVAGNVDATPATHAWTIDTDDTPPVITPVVSGTLGENGWYVGDVSIGWNVSDADSAIGSSSGCNTVVLSTDTAGATFTCTASSIGGTASKSVTVKLDKTAPQISAAATTAPNAAGWYRDDVAIAYTCSDALSGVVACPTTQLLTGEGAPLTSAPRTVMDAAGNTSAPVSATLKIDRTAPMLTPSVAQPLLLHADAAAESYASDGLSGIAGKSCSALATGSVGVKWVECTATDNAGNTVSASTDYRVSYGFAGFEAPLAAALNGVQAKKYLPFKWRAFDANNADVANLASVTITRLTMACPVGVTPVPVTAYGTSNTSLQYLGGGRYQRNWLLSTGLAGSCMRLTIDLGDGVPHDVMVKL